VAYEKLVRAQVDDRCGARRGTSNALTAS